MKELRKNIVTAIKEIAGDVFNDVYFQLDGTSPHYFCPVREYLNEDRTKRSHRVASSFTGSVKVYSTKTENSVDLRLRIINETYLIEESTFKNVIILQSVGVLL